MKTGHLIAVIAVFLAVTSRLPAAEIISLAPKSSCSEVFTIRQAKLLEKLQSEAADSRNFALHNQLGDIRKTLPTYDTVHSSYFSLESGGLRLLIELRPYGAKYTGQPGLKAQAENMANFSLEFRPDVESYGSQFRAIFGNKPLRFDLSHVQYSSNGCFSELPGVALSVGLVWKGANNQIKEALLMISRDTGQVFLYPQPIETANNIVTALYEAIRDLGRGAVHELRNKLAKRTGDWYSESDVLEVSWNAGNHRIPLAPVVD